jgi:DNA-binding PadR family transcriptional regulator
MDSHCGLGRHGHHGHGGLKSGFLGGFGGFMGGGRAFRAARMLASEDLQLIILALLEEKPRHGYDIIKALEEHSSGLYTPSPGVVYPALTYLEEMGFTVSEASGNKKLYAITETGKEQLAKNREIVEETLEQLSRFGRKMARVQKHFADEEAENDFEQSDSRSGGRREWRKMKSEFRALKEELKATLWEKIDASNEEKMRVLEVLRRALAEIREAPKNDPTDKRPS